MSVPSTSREVLIVETLTEAARLLEAIQALAPKLDASRQALADAHRGLADQMTDFHKQVIGLCDKAKLQAVTYILARTDEAAKRAIELQGRAMTEAARAAFEAEVNVALQRLRQVQLAMEKARGAWWEPWFTHAVAAGFGSAVTWALITTPWAR